VKLVTTSLAFGPEGSDLFAAGFHDGRIALWQASERYPIGQFDEGMNGEVTALIFRYGADGRLKLVAGSSRGEVREYDVDLHSWQESACLLTQNLNLTQEERKKFLPDSDPQAVTCPP
jgi:WD40 repeat protein